VGTTFTGIHPDTEEEISVEVTASGLLLAAHLVGTRNIRDMFRDETIRRDGNGTLATYYMDRFGGYDLTDIFN